MTEMYVMRTMNVTVSVYVFEQNETVPSSPKTTNRRINRREWSGAMAERRTKLIAKLYSLLYADEFSIRFKSLCMFECVYLCW